MNLASLVQPHEASARAFHSDGRWHSWGEVRRRTAAVARGLGDCGVVPGDRVAIAWPNSVDFVVGYLGVLASGAVAVPLNPNSPSAEMAREIDKVGASVVLAGGSAAEKASEVSASANRVRIVAPSTFARRPETLEPASLSWEEMSAEGTEGDSPELDSAGGVDSGLQVVEREGSDLAVLLFTSGTAGSPRAAMLTHRNLVSNIEQMLELPDILNSDDVGLAAVPLFHVFGLNVALGLALATGAALVFEERFDARKSLELIRDLGVTTLVGVPTMFAAWAAVEDSSDGPGTPVLAGVRRAISGASALPVDVAERFEQRYHLALRQGYGLTEASPAVATSLGAGRNRPGSVGRPLPGVEVSLVDEEGTPVLAGDAGEIWVRGPNVFAGYWDDDEATSQVLTEDGWLKTGDIAVVGDSGDIYVVDRKKDLIIVSGFNVYPAEVEQVIGEMPGVAGAAVIGRPDALTGESVEAFVVREDGASLSEEDLRRHCARALARYKCPTTVCFVPELPTGLAGKALRRALREQTS